MLMESMSRFSFRVFCGGAAPTRHPAGFAPGPPPRFASPEAVRPRAQRWNLVNGCVRWGFNHGLADVVGCFDKLELKRPGDFRAKVLRPMHKERLIEYDQDARTVALLPLGVDAAETLIRELDIQQVTGPVQKDRLFYC